MSDFVLKLSGVPEAPREYECPEHGPFETVVELATSRDPRPCPECGKASERTITCNIATHVNVHVPRGKSDPPPPHAMDTRDLASGKVTMKEFRARRRAYHRDVKRREAKQKGLLR